MATSDSWQRTDTQLSPAQWKDESTRIAELKGKRAFDLVFSVIGLVLWFPVIALGSAAVWLESRGSVFSRTTCWGRGTHEFERLCLRTTDGEGRMTRIGRILDRLGIDELPQFFNVLRGEMSIVGPAPIPPEGRAGASVRHLRRFEVQPGMTGMWTLGAGSDAELGSYFSPDQAYRSSRSLWLDLAMVARKLSAIVEGRHC